MIYWLKLLPKLGLGAWILIMHLTFRCGCKERFLFREKSWQLSVEPSPLPEFYAWACEAGWYVGAGWFRLFVRRSH